MKLAPRITIAVTICGVVLFGGSGIYQLRREERDLHAVARKEGLLLSRSLQVAFENALRDRQIGDVSKMLGALATVDPAVAIYVYDHEASFVESSDGARPSAEIVSVQERARAAERPIVEFTPPREPRVLLVGLRLRHGTSSGSTGVMVLEKPLTDMQRDLAAERRGTLFTVLGFVLAITGLVWVLARSYVSRPLSRMYADMERVRTGDLGQVEDSPRQDEIGAIQREFASLVRDLEASRGRADREHEARARIERSLQEVDKLITIGQLAAVMAHEIGSPLQILEGRARALLKHAEDANATRRTAYMLIEQTERVTRIVGQMLSITRRRTPVRVAIDAERSVRDVVALLEIDAKRRRVQLSVEKAVRCDVVADPDQLQQVVLNLVRNALDASSCDSTVHVRLGGDDRNFVLEVTDQGPGISPSIRPHLFEPFFTTKLDHGGSGLGLSVVKAIVQEHGGKITFPQDLESGCVARVVLPRNG